MLEYRLEVAMAVMVRMAVAAVIEALVGRRSADVMLADAFRVGEVLAERLHWKAFDWEQAVSMAA